jgi:VCBS repeat-containing protein
MDAQGNSAKTTYVITENDGVQQINLEGSAGKLQNIDITNILPDNISASDLKQYVKITSKGVFVDKTGNQNFSDANLIATFNATTAIDQNNINLILANSLISAANVYADSVTADNNLEADKNIDTKEEAVEELKKDSNLVDLSSKDSTESINNIEYDNLSLYEQELNKLLSEDDNAKFLTSEQQYKFINELEEANQLQSSFAEVPVDVNNAPVVDQGIASQTIAEEANLAFRIPQNAFKDVDGDNLTFTATLADGSPLPSWLSFNPETKVFSGLPDDAEIGIISVKVIATDGEYPVDTTFDLKVTAVNDIPTAISLSANTINENDSGAIVGQLKTTDVDVGDTHKYTVSDDRFEVVNDQLKLKNDISLNHEVEPLAPITVTTTDTAGATHSQLFNITVQDVAEAAVITGTSSGSVVEDDSPIVLTKTGVLNVADEDVGEAHFIAETVIGTYGSLDITDDGHWTYTADNSQEAIQQLTTSQALNFNKSNTDAVRVDADLISNDNFTISLWVKPDSIVNDQGILGAESDGVRAPSIWVYYDGSLHWDSVDADGNRYSGTTPQIFTENEWSHITWVKDGTEYRFYNNGELIHTDAAPNQVNLLGFTDFGKVNHPLGGQLDDIQTYSKALSVEEITSVMQGETHSELLAHYNFEGDSLSSALIDKTGNNPDAVSSADKTDADLVVGHPNSLKLIDTVTVKTIDGTTQAIEIEISGTQDIAVISGISSQEITEDSANILTTSGKLEIEDADANDAYFVPKTVAGSYGTLVIDATGQWSYTADNSQIAIQQLGEGEQLADTITVTTVDGTTKDISVAITGTNDAPVATPVDFGSIDEDTVRIITKDELLLNATDVDANTTLNVNNLVLADSTNGEITYDDNDGTWTFTPAKNFNADNVQLNYNVNDGITDIATSGSFDIKPVNDAPYFLPADAVASFSLDGVTSDTTEITDSVSGLSGTVTAGSLFAGEGDSIDGSHAHFNGTQKIEIADTGVDPAATDATLSFWMKWDGTTAGFPVSFGRYALWVTDDGIGFTTFNGGDRWGSTYENLSLEDGSTGLANEWHHITATFHHGDSTLSTLHIDGISQDMSFISGTSSSAANADIHQALAISGTSITGGFMFHGDLDDVKIFDQSFTDAEATQIYQVASNEFAIDENSAAGTAIATAKAAEYDAGDVVTYSLTDDAGGKFVIDAQTGAISVADGAELNYEANDKHSITIRATDASGDFSENVTTVEVNDINEAPVVGADIEATVLEDNSITITEADLLLNATDPEGNALSVTNLQANGGTINVTHNQADNTWTLNPAANWSGTAILTFDVSDNISPNPTPAQMNLIVNPDVDAPTLTVTGDTVLSTLNFENNQLSEGWSVEHYAEIRKLIDYGTDAYEGEYGLELDAYGAHTAGNETPDALYYTVDTSQGHEHKISLWAHERMYNNGTDHIEIVWNGEVIETINPTPAWVEYVITLPDTHEATTQLAIREVADQNQGSGPLLDLITLTRLGASTSEDPNVDYVFNTNEDNRIALNIEATLIDKDGSEVLTKTLAGLPLGFIVTDGEHNFTAYGADIDVSTWDLNNLTITPVENYNSNVTLTLTATATESDGSPATETKTLLLKIQSINDAPTDISLSSNTISENVAGAVIGDLTTVDIDAGDSHEYTVSDNRFEVIGDQLKLKDAISLDHETEPTVSVTVTSTDSAGAPTSQLFSVVVEDANDAPEVDQGIANQTIAEESTLSYQVPDNAFKDADNDTLTFSATLADGSPLPSWLSFNAATKTFSGTPDDAEVGGISVKVTAVDAEHSADAIFNLEVTTINDIPTAITLSANNIAENVAGAVVGILATTDVDAGDSHTYTISDNRFEVVGDQLKLKNDISLDHETEPTAPITVISTDTAGATHTQIFSINIQNVNEAPELVDGDSGITSEDVLFSGQLTATDQDENEVLTFSLETPPIEGSISINDNGSYDFNPGEDFQDLAEGATRDINFTYKVTDSQGEFDIGSQTIRITGTNDAPVVTPINFASIDEDTVRIITKDELLLNATDVDANTTLNVNNLVLADSTNGEITYDDNDGTWTFTPAKNFNADNVQLNYNVNDGITDIATSGSFDIKPVNDAPYFLPADAVASFSLDGVTSDTTEITDSVSGLSGTVTAGSLFAGEGDSIDGSHAHFNGTQKIEIADTGVDPAATDATLSFWMKWDGTTAGFPVSFGRYALWVTDDGIGFTTFNGGDRWGSTYENLSLEDGSTGLANEWHHITATFHHGDSTLSTLHIDGISQDMSFISGTSSSAANADIHQALAISGTSITGGFMFHGDLDDVKIFDQSFTDAEATQIYQVASNEFAIDENSAAGTAIATAKAAEYDAGDVVTYSLTDDAGGKFVIDAQTGAISVADGAELNYEANDKHSITIRATDASGDFSENVTTVEVNDINEAPVVGADIEATVLEDNSITITEADLLLNATDPEGNALSVTNLQANGGTINVTHNQADNTWTLNPAANWSGTAILTFDVSDNISPNPTPAQMNLIVNPDVDAPTLTVTGDTVLSTLNFENNQLSEGWSVEHYAEIRKLIDYGTDAYEGEYGLELDAYGAHTAGNETPDALYYTVDTSQGHEHKISLWAHERMYNNGTDHIEIVWNGEVIETINPTPAWVEYVITLPDTHEATTQLAIREVADQNQGSGPLLDLITLTRLGASTSEDPNVDYVFNTNEDNRIALNIEATLIDKDGSEVLTKTLAGLPLGFIVTDGEHNFTAYGADIDVSTWDLNNLTITPVENYNSNVTLTLTATATESDGSPATETKTLLLKIQSINDAPTDISLSSNTISENVAGAVIGDLTTVDIDAGDSHEYTVSDNRFEVIGDQLKLKDAISLDHETEPTVSVTVTSTDSAGAPTSQLFSVVVEDANDAPTEISLSSNTIAENSAGAIVGDLTTTDVDTGDSHNYTVSDNRFEIIGDQLKLKNDISLDHETEPTVSVTVTSTDSLGAPHSQLFSIGVENVNEAPEVSAAVTAVTTEDSPITLTKAQLLEHVTDPDENTEFTITNVQINGGNVAAIYNGDETWTFTPTANWSGAALVSFDVSDGIAAPAVAQLNLTVNPEVDTPVLEATGGTIISTIDFNSHILPPGWTSENNLERGGVYAYEGDYGIELDAGGAPAAADALYYNVDTSQGNDHKVSLWVKQRSGSIDGSDHVEIVWNGEVLHTIDPTTTWGVYTVELPNTGANSTQLTIREVAEQNQGNGPLVDFINVIRLNSTTNEDPNIDYTIHANEDGLIPVELTAKLIDTDGSETRSLSLSGLPAGFSLTDGASTIISDGSTIDINTLHLNNLTIIPLEHYDSNVTFTVTATSTESDSSTATITKTILLEIEPINDAPELADTPLAESIEAAYNFDENSGNALDKTGANHNLTLTGSASRGTGYTGTGSAFEMDGTEGHGEIQGVTTGGAMSVSTWVKFDSFAEGWSRIFDFNDVSGSNVIQLSHMGTGNTLAFEVINNAGTPGETEKLHISNFFTVGEWVHVTASIDDTGLMSIYKNGELAGSHQGIVPEETVRDNNYIGKSAWSSDGYFNGSIDDFVIYNKALTAEEMQTVFQTTTVNELVQNTLFVDENSINGTVVDVIQATDIEGNNLEYSLTNSAGGRFAIDSVTGEVTVANGNLLDFETTNSHLITVQVSDGSLTDSKNYYVKLKNVDVEGTAADDTLTGTTDSDYIKGMAANDSLDGAEGDDVLSGGAGNDILTGGTGSDSFIWHTEDLGTSATPSEDTITDFQTGANGDVIELDGILQDTANHSLDEYLHLNFADGNTTIDVAPVASGDVTQKITLQGVDLSGYGGGTTDAEIINNLLNDGNLDVH